MAAAARRWLPAPALFWAPRGGGAPPPPLALGREFILGLAGNTIAIGDFFGRATHLVAAKRIRHQGQRAVDQRRLAEAPANLGPRQQVRLDRHILVPAGDDDLGLAGAQLLHGAVDRLQTGATEAVDVKR